MKIDGKRAREYLSFAIDESLAEHDDRYHNGHFDPSKGTCGKREGMSGGDDSDNLGGEDPDERTTKLAPNGKRSNLTNRQYAQVRSKEFKAWFGDWENDPANASKVLDENGEPLVVYRGEGSEQTEFFFGYREDNGWLQRNWFTSSKDVAGMYGDTHGRGYYLNIRNVAEYDANGKRYNDLNYKGEWVSNGVVDRLYDDNPMADGVVLRNIVETEDGNVAADDWLIKDNLRDAASRIKSATDNTGSFDPNDPDIRH